MSLNVYFVRHGETKESESSFSQTPKSCLSKDGIKQSKLVAKYLKDKNISRILSSEWERAKETAEVLSKILNISVEVIGNIHEKEQDEKLYGISKKDPLYKRHHEELIDHYYDYEWKFLEAGESFKDLFERAHSFLISLAKLPENNNMIVVSHGLFIKALLITVMLDGIQNEKVFMRLFRSFDLDKGSVSLVEFNFDRNTKHVRYINNSTFLKY